MALSRLRFVDVFVERSDHGFPICVFNLSTPEEERITQAEEERITQAIKRELSSGESFPVGFRCWLMPVGRIFVSSSKLKEI